MEMRIIVGLFIAMILSGCQTIRQNIIHQESIIDIVAAEIRNDLPMRDSPGDEVASCLMGVRYEQDGDIRKAINQYLSVGRSQRIEGPWEITIYARLRAALCHISIHENQEAIDIFKQVIGCRTIAVGSNRNWSHDNGVTRVTVSNIVG